jgi:hypothetical protein
MSSQVKFQDVYSVSLEVLVGRRALSLLGRKVALAALEASAEPHLLPCDKR